MQPNDCILYETEWNWMKLDHVGLIRESTIYSNVNYTICWMAMDFKAPYKLSDYINYIPLLTNLCKMFYTIMSRAGKLLTIGLLNF